jgi:hypothetical protein
LDAELVDRDGVDVHPRPVRWQWTGTEHRSHGFGGLAQHGAGVFGCAEHFLGGNYVELDSGVGVGTGDIGWGIPVLGVELIELHPGGFLGGVVVDQVHAFGDGLNEFRAELLLLRGIQAFVHQVHANENHHIVLS